MWDSSCHEGLKCRTMCVVCSVYYFGGSLTSSSVLYTATTQLAKPVMYLKVKQYRRKLVLILNYCLASVSPKLPCQSVEQEIVDSKTSSDKNKSAKRIAVKI